MIGRELKLITGNANIQLAREISNALGVDLCDTAVERFNDGEIQVRIRETVRGADVFVIQPTSPPVNDHLMELLIIIDALRRASAQQVIAVIPYYGYGRQDRKHTGRVPITARLVANLIETAGADRVLTMDLHAGQIQGFFNLPVDNLRSDPIFAAYYREAGTDFEETVVVSPDVGGTARARIFAEQLDLPLAVLEKRRPPEGGTEVKVMRVIGDVTGKKVIVIDDIVSSGKTLIQAAQTLLDHGASEVSACCTHGVFSPGALEALEHSSLKKIVATNTICYQDAEKSDFVEYVSVGEHLAKTIRQIFEYKSVSHLFPHY
ncbi:MAG TPA: ribose-phosphate pyrophosphokinase [Candidatus Heimdallarchaeota archaeon]|nr:ribose-phosphate pyrophosphokinase [Candidatus Heimdallarchaeota archaeon]